MKISMPKLIRVQRDWNSFRVALSNIEMLARTELYDADEGIRRMKMVEVYDFAIKAIGTELAISPTTKYLLHGTRIDRDIIPYTKPYREKAVAIEGNAVWSFPYNQYKLKSAIYDIKNKGFINLQHNCTGVYYEELGLIHITNGFHHAAAAFFEKTGEVELEVIRLSDYFDSLTTDGAFWICSEGKTRCEDYRLAVLYELARRRSLHE